MQIHMQAFHRRWWKTKVAGYLLITQSFPHSPHVYPQEFSTGRGDCGYSFLVDIRRNRSFREKPTFSAVVDFYQGGFFVQNLGLDRHPAGRENRPVPAMGKKFKKGVDFVLKRRYNVCLYGKLTQGGEIHAQHQVLQEGCPFFQDRL